MSDRERGDPVVIIDADKLRYENLTVYLEATDQFLAEAISRCRESRVSADRCKPWQSWREIVIGLTRAY